MSTALLATLVVDPCLLFIGGYFVTLILYKYITALVRYSGVRRFFVLLFPLTLFGLWLGGILPYAGCIESSTVYFGILPRWLVGPQDGNDFMWNGLGVHWFGKLVPDALIPTHRYIGFNVLAVLIWISYPVILGWSVLEGQAAALVVKSKRHLVVLQWLRVVAIGIFLSLMVAAFTALMVRIYT